MVLADLVAKVEAAHGQAQNVVVGAQAAVGAYEALLAELKAEEVRVPTADDIRALLDRMEAGNAKT